MKTNIVGISGSATAWVAVITPQMEQMEFYLRCLSYVGAVAVSVVTLYYMIKRRGKQP